MAWPPVRLASLGEELNALRAVQGETPQLLYGDAKLWVDTDLTAQGAAGCEALDRVTALLSTQMRVGEVKELRDRLATHPLSRTALATRYVEENPSKR